MEKVKFLILVVLYKLSPEDSDTLLSLSKCKEALTNARILIRDNSPSPYTPAERATLGQLLGDTPYEYRHNGQNEYLSTIYNQTIRELRADEYLVIFDHDSAFDAGFFAAALRAIHSHPSTDLFLPLVYCGDQLVSPSRMVLFKGSYLPRPPHAICPSRHAMAINSGMVISGRYLKTDFPGYDEDYHFYVTDCDFMWTYSRLRPNYCALDYRMNHSLDFYGHEEPFESKKRRFREMRRGFLTAMRKRSLAAYVLCYIYMDIYSAKFALTHRDRRFLFIR